MAYSAEISRSHPTVILILLDQSSSMADSFAGGTESKAVEAARVVNRFLTELTIKCAKGEGIRDYYEVGIFGYGSGVVNAFGAPLNSNVLNPISVIGDSPLRLDQLTRKVSDGAGGLVETQASMPVWVDAVANGSTPMCQALSIARDTLSDWIRSHPESYAATVINVTDGEANDGDPSSFAQALTATATNDGNTLLFNCHISASQGPQSTYPSTDEGLADRFARQLFSMSSPLPPAPFEAARGMGYAVSEGSRGFFFNASVEGLIDFIDIGTRASNLQTDQ